MIDLGQAATGNWTKSNSARAGRGIYDPNLSAVVFKYSSITIESNCTVTIVNHPAQAPVVWLVADDIVVNGTIHASGRISLVSSGGMLFGEGAAVEASEFTASSESGPILNRGRLIANGGRISLCAAVVNQAGKIQPTLSATNWGSLSWRRVTISIWAPVPSSRRRAAARATVPAARSPSSPATLSRMRPGSTSMLPAGRTAATAARWRFPRGG